MQYKLMCFIKLCVPKRKKKIESYEIILIFSYIFIFIFWQLRPGWHAELHIMSFFLNVHFFYVQFVRQAQRRYPYPVKTQKTFLPISCNRQFHKFSVTYI